jgi:heme exporter protein D
MFDAGEYAAYVWPAYGITALVIGWLVADSLLRSRRWRKRAEARKSERAR